MSEREARILASRFIAVERGGRLWKDQVYAALAQEFPAARCKAAALLDDYLRSFPRACRLRPGFTELLIEMRSLSVRIGVVTNKRKDMRSAVMRALGLGAPVDAVIISEANGFRKSQAEIFHLAMSRFGSEGGTTASS